MWKQTKLQTSKNCAQCFSQKLQLLPDLAGPTHNPRIPHEVNPSKNCSSDSQKQLVTTAESSSLCKTSEHTPNSCQQSHLQLLDSCVYFHLKFHFVTHNTYIMIGTRKPQQQEFEYFLLIEFPIIVCSHKFKILPCHLLVSWTRWPLTTKRTPKSTGKKLKGMKKKQA